MKRESRSLTQLLEVAVPIRALFSSFLLALVLIAGINTAAATAATAKAPKAKVALGAKKKAKAKKAKKVKKVKKLKKARKASKSPRTSVPVPAPAAAPAAPPAAPEVCANTDLLPDAGNLDLIRAALVCLHNQVRAQHGLGALSENGALAAAGAAHSTDMVQRRYFDHTTPEGGTFSERILAARYAGANDAWSLGENLAWGTGARSTPAALMGEWMASEGHRHNILTAAYREIGFGFSVGTPSGAGTGLTVAVEFGARI